MTSLLQAGGAAQLSRLWSRGNFYLYPGSQLMAAFAIWFPMFIWTTGSAVSGGIFVPALYVTTQGTGLEKRERQKTRGFFSV